MSLFDQVNTKDNSNEAVTKEKHLPVISIEKLDDSRCKVRVDVGSGKHPNDIDHWIQWVELRLNGLYVGRAEFSANVLDPIAEFVIKCNGSCEISALARCNKHGLWESKISC